MAAARKTEGSEDTLSQYPLTLDLSPYLRLIAHNLTQSYKTEDKIQTDWNYRCCCQKPLFSPTNADQAVIQKSITLVTHLIAAL